MPFPLPVKRDMLDSEMQSEFKKLGNIPNLAGIIPISEEQGKFNMPWHDCMMPLAPNLMAVEHAVLKCAYLGCNTIWIITTDSMISILRSRLGEYAYDPVNKTKLDEKGKVVSSNLKHIPIYYLPYNPIKSSRRDTLTYNILFAAINIKKLLHKASGYLVPQRYFVSSPYCIYPQTFLVDYRHSIRQENELFITAPSGKYVLQERRMDFTFPYYVIRNMVKRFQIAEKYRIPQEYADKIDRDICPEASVRLTPGQLHRRVFTDYSELFYIKSLDARPEWCYIASDWDSYLEFLRRVPAGSLYRPHGVHGVLRDGGYRTLGYAGLIFDDFPNFPYAKYQKPENLSEFNLDIEIKRLKKLIPRLQEKLQHLQETKDGTTSLHAVSELQKTTVEV